MPNALTLFAQSTAAAPETSETLRTTFELGRVLNFGPLQWLLLGLVVVAVFALVIYVYIRDCVELGGLIAAVLITLRLGAFLGLLWIYLLPQMRVERDQEINSQVVLAVDTSLSMGKQDEGYAESRADKVIEALKTTPLLDRLRRTHDVHVWTFDSEAREAATLARHGATDETKAEDAEAQADDAKPRAPPDWDELLRPKGSETRLGQALRQIVTKHRGAPLSGVVVVTEGRNNAGLDPSNAVAAARDERVKIFPIGVGSERREAHVRLADFQVPPRAFPGDAYTALAQVKASGMANRDVTVELYSRDANAAPEANLLEESQSVTLGDDEEATVVRFTLTPEEPGRRILTARVQTPPDVGTGQQTESEKVIEIVDHQTRVLLFAGGPLREYRFLRNQLRRDESMIVDVLLQSAQPGVSQDANKILDEFPTDKAELYEYDCIVAFDPDWRQLDQEQIDHLEDWVAKGSGGLVVIPGPVYADEWVHDRKEAEKLEKIRALYPVVFQQRFSILDDSHFDNDKAWPIKFTDPQGTGAQFLWLEDTQIASEQAWRDFEGVYGYYGVRGPKSAATLYAQFSDPSADEGGGLPPYMAQHFYGSGRVFYMGSAEMWRIRSVDDAYYETFWTKLIRHVSQGTLLRGSKRGVLLVEQDQYLLGDNVNVRAQLQDAQFLPLAADSVPLEVIHPDDKLQTVPLNSVEGNPGTFGGQFTVYKEGTYRLRLSQVETGEELSWSIDVRLPDLENENTQRNDPLLSQIAQDSGGRYYVGLPAALQMEGPDTLLASLPDATQVKTLTDKPQTLWDNRWTLFIVCGLLCLEWLIRRLAKLA